MDQLKTSPGFAMVGGIGAIELVAIVVLVAFFARLAFGRRHGTHSMGCMRGLIGLTILGSVGFVLLTLIFTARIFTARRVAQPPPAGWTAYPPLSKMPNFPATTPGSRFTNRVGPLATITVALDPEAIRRHDVTADEISDSLLKVVDTIRAAQRTIVDGATQERHIELASLDGIPIRAEMPFKEISRLTCTRPLGAPDALIASMGVQGMGGRQGDWGTIMSTVHNRFVQENSTRTDNAEFEAKLHRDLVIIEFNPLTPPAPPEPVASNSDQPAVARNSAPPAEPATAAPDEDGASAAAGVAATVATSITEAIKTSLQSKDAASPETTDPGAVAKKIAAQAVAAVLNATLSDRADAKEPEATPTEPAAPIKPAQVEPVPTATAATETAATALLPPEPPAHLIPQGREPANDEERAALEAVKIRRERLEAAAQAGRADAAMLAENGKTAPRHYGSNEELHAAMKAQFEALREIGQAQRANSEAANAARRAAQTTAVERMRKNVGERIHRTFVGSPNRPVAWQPKFESQRPAWLDEPSEQQLNDKDVFRLIGSTGALYSTPQDAGEAVPAVVDQLTRQYVDLLFGEHASTGLSIGDISRRLAKTSLWTERVESPVSSLPLYETHVSVEFDENARRAIEDQWRNARTNGRLVYAMTIAGVVLGFIGTLFGYLKLDTATRGYYSGRLKLAAGTFVSILVAVAFLILSGRLGI